MCAVPCVRVPCEQNRQYQATRFVRRIGWCVSTNLHGMRRRNEARILPLARRWAKSHTSEAAEESHPRQAVESVAASATPKPAESVPGALKPLALGSAEPELRKNSAKRPSASCPQNAGGSCSVSGIQNRSCLCASASFDVKSSRIFQRESRLAECCPNDDY